ncbi:MAG: hypothetical protein NT047_08900 [Deltaproteobacteria bacterium]|nr:hypothetical protein [Deltaproteobacteria bacterium]
MKPVNKPEEKIGKIIFSRVLSMPMAKYREYIASVCGTPVDPRRDDGGQTGETVFARVKISGRNPATEIADNCFMEIFPVPAADPRIICSMRWINTRNRFSRHILRNLLRYQKQYWLTERETNLRPLSLKRFLAEYPLQYLDVSRLSRLLAVLRVETPKGGNIGLRSLFVSNLRFYSFVIKEIINQSKNSLNDRRIQERLRQKGIAVSVRTVCHARGLLHIPNYAERNKSGYEGTAQFSGYFPLNRENIARIPEIPGIYEISAAASVNYQKGKSMTAYLGATKCLRRRLMHYTNGQIKNTALLPIIRESGVNVRYFPTDNYRDCEKRLLLNFKACFGELPVANVLGGGTHENR